MWACFDALEKHNAPRAAFLSTMIEGGSDAQLARTATLSRNQVGVVAVGGFGTADALAPITKRFSLHYSRVSEFLIMSASPSVCAADRRRLTDGGGGLTV